jgi:predicted O-linked N-acetylglucosamine transferase (SPINDLY family)/glycosyltransferase involved in cell wall biosynthesis
MKRLHYLLGVLLLYLPLTFGIRKCPCPADIDGMRDSLAAGRGASQMEFAYESYNKGVACAALEMHCCAASHYLAAIDLRPVFPQAFQNLALLFETGCEDLARGLRLIPDRQKSLYYHRMSVEHAPDAEFLVGALSNTFSLETREPGGKQKDILQRMAGELSNALSSLPQPWPENAHFQLTTLHNDLGEKELAHRELQALLANYPAHAMALLNTGNYHFNRDEFTLARSYYVDASRAMASNPRADYINQVMVICNIGQCHREQSEYSLAEVSFQDALTLLRSITSVRPETSRHRYHLGTEVFVAMNLFAIKSLACSWREYENLEQFLLMSAIGQIERPLDYVTEGMGGSALIDPYTFTLQRYSSRALDLSNSRLACASVASYAEAPSLKSLRSLFDSSTDGNLTHSNRTLRVGYISRDWRYHPMGRLTMKLVSSHSSGSVNASCISYGENDHSSVRHYVQSRMGSQFYDIQDISSDEAASSAVSQLELDVIVDLQAHTYKGRIFVAALRPAPIVINYLGYPGSTGCKGFDFVIVDRFVAPADLAPSAFSEKMIYLPHIYQSNYMPPYVLPCMHRDRRKCRSRVLLSRVDNLPGNQGQFANADNWAHEGRTWLCSFNANKKLEPMVFQTWMQLLQETPRALLLLLDVDVNAKVALVQSAAMYGVHASRLVFIRSMPWLDHLYRLSACDYVLDTFTYGAHTTASDALWMWVPVLSLEGTGSQRMPSRVAAAITLSLLGKNAAIPVLQTVKQYQSVAVRLAQELLTTYELHDAIAKAALREPTFSHAAMQMNVERAYQAAVESRSTQFHANMHVIAGTAQVFDDANQRDLLKDEIVTALTACVNRKTNINQFCHLTAVGALSGRLLASYPQSVSAQLLRELVVSDGVDGTLDEVRIERCDALLKEWTLYGNLTDPLAMERVSLWLQPCVLVTPVKVLEYWLALQVADPSCEKDSSLFNILAPLFLQRAYGWRLDWGKNMPADMANQLSRLLPKLFVTQAMGWDVSPHFKSVFRHNSKETADFVRSLFAQALNNHAVCMLSRPGELQASILTMASAYDIDPVSNRLMNLGLTMQRVSSNEGHRIAAVASVQLHDARRAEYLKSPRPTITPWAGSGLSVAIYCYEYGNAYWGRWGPSSMEDGGGGLGGSEEAVLYMAEELAKRGHRVTVYADPPDQDLRRGLIRGVRWRRHTEYDSAPGWAGAADVFISWRYGLSLDIGANARKRLLWLQDLIGAESLPPPGTSLNYESSVLVLGSFHRSELILHLQQLGYAAQLAQNVPVIVPNGIDMRYFTDMQGSNLANQFVYGSSPVRGLEQLLRIWPLIRAAVYGAVLKVYYGFPVHVSEQLRKSMGNEEFDAWRAEMDRLLGQEGVVYVGAVGHAELARAYAAAGFLLYPTQYPETGCITVQKAMAAGAIPITSRFTSSVLPHLTKDWDMGPKLALRPGENYANWMSEHWLPAIVEASKLPAATLHNHRERMKAHTREHYSWAKSANILESLFPEELKD